MKLRAAKLKLFQTLQRDLRLAKLPSLNVDNMKMLQSQQSNHALKVLKAKADALSKNKDALNDVKTKIAKATAK